MNINVKSRKSWTIMNNENGVIDNDDQLSYKTTYNYEKL